MLAKSDGNVAKHFCQTVGSFANFTTPTVKFVKNLRTLTEIVPILSNWRVVLTCSKSGCHSPYIEPSGRLIDGNHRDVRRDHDQKATLQRMMQRRHHSLDHLDPEPMELFFIRFLLRFFRVDASIMRSSYGVEKRMCLCVANTHASLQKCRLRCNWDSRPWIR